MLKSSSKSVQLSIIILNYNLYPLLEKCLVSIPKDSSWEIIIPDNGSTDDSIAKLKANFPDVKIIENGKNLGFAAGNNVAIKQAQGEYVLLLNPDTEVKGNAIETVLHYMQQNPQVGAATCRVELPDGSLDYSSHRGFPDPVSSLLHFLGFRKISHYSSTSVPSTIHEIDSLTGAFALIRASAGQQVGWLDEDYFWNGEDIDFCYKLKECGWKIMFLPSVKVIHYKGSAAKASKSRRLAWAKNSTNVMQLFYRKHLAKKYPFILNQLVYAGIFGLRIVRTIRA